MSYFLFISVTCENQMDHKIKDDSYINT